MNNTLMRVAELLCAALGGYLVGRGLFHDHDALTVVCGFVAWTAAVVSARWMPR